jgi:hypothetical protein
LTLGQTTCANASRRRPAFGHEQDVLPLVAKRAEKRYERVEAVGRRFLAKRQD